MLPSSSRGFVLAHMRTSGSLRRMDGWQYMTVHSEDGGNDRFDCISLAQRARLPFSIFLFTLIAALMSLPATTPLPLGEYPRHSGRLPLGRECETMDLPVDQVCAGGATRLFHLCRCRIRRSVLQFHDGAIYPARASRFSDFSSRFRWILQDQRKRCPVCLRVLSNPARVGQASRNFLAWNGTELICAGVTDCCTFLSYQPAGSAPSAGCTSILPGAASSLMRI